MSTFYNKLEESIITESNKTSIEDTIDLLIKDEQEAIDGYYNAKLDLRGLFEQGEITIDTYSTAMTLYEHIITEEKEHIEELESFKSSLDI